MPFRRERRLLGVDVEVALLAAREDHLAPLVGEAGEEIEEALALAHAGTVAGSWPGLRDRSSSQPMRSRKTRSRSGSWKISWRSPSYCLNCLSWLVACSKNSRAAFGSAIRSAPPHKTEGGANKL